MRSLYLFAYNKGLRCHRYSITTYFIHCLLVAGFQNPHTLLTSYVRMHHGIQPADGPKLMNTILRDDYDLLAGGHNRYDPASTLPRGVCVRETTTLADFRFQIPRHDLRHRRSSID